MLGCSSEARIARSCSNRSITSRPADSGVTTLMATCCSNRPSARAGEVDSAHASPSDFAQDFIGAEAATLHAVRLGAKLGWRCEGTVEEGDGVFAGLKHAFHLRVEIGVGSYRFCQESRPRSGRFLQRGFENIANLAEPLWRHVAVLHTV